MSILATLKKAFLKLLVLWVILTTVLPRISSYFQLNSIPIELQNKKIQLLIAHPDDEVMFFAPTLTQLNKPEYGNTISVTCYTGDLVRKPELLRSLQILGIDKIEVLNDPVTFKDDMSVTWDVKKVLEYVDPDADILLTFDDAGVSDHPNHKSLFNAVRTLKRPTLSLVSYSFLKKYSTIIIPDFKLFSRYFLGGAYTSDLENDDIDIFSDIPSSILGFSAMMNGHPSQMLWFRWFWLIFSQYGYRNTLNTYNF